MQPAKIIISPQLLATLCLICHGRALSESYAVTAGY